MKTHLRTLLSSDAMYWLQIFGRCWKTPPGAGDEIQLTDAIAMLMENNTVEAFHMSGKSHDCGDKLGYMKAFVQYGLRHQKEGAAFTHWLKQVLHDK